MLHGAYATSAIWLLLGMTPSRDALLGPTMATWLILQLSALFTILTQKKLLAPTLLSCANTTVPMRLWRLATMERALLLLIGSEELHRRLVLEVSVARDALRQTGRPMETPGTPTAFTILLFELSRDRHLPLPEVVELLFPVSDLFRVVSNGLTVLFSMGRLDSVSPVPHVWVVVRVLLVRGHG